MTQQELELGQDWQRYVTSMHHLLDQVQAACTGTGEELLDAEAPGLPGAVPPEELIGAVRTVHLRMQSLLPAVEARRNELIGTVQRLSATRRPPALQDHREALGRALDCVG